MGKFGFGIMLVVALFCFGIPSFAYDTRARQIKPDTTNFDGVLSTTDTTLQKVSDTMDGMLDGDVSIGGELTCDSIFLREDDNIVSIEGRLWYGEGSLNWGRSGGVGTTQIGEEVVRKVVNKSGADIPNGKVIYISGRQDQRDTIELADKQDVNTIHFLAMTTEDISNNASGCVTLLGDVNGTEDQPIDTTSFLEGEKLYLDISGDLTNSHPSNANDAVVVVARAGNIHATQGSYTLLNPTYYTNGNEFDGVMRQSIINKSVGTNSVSSMTVINDSGYRGSIDMVGSNHSNFPQDAFTVYNQGFGDFGFLNDGDVDFIWYSDPTDSHDYSSLSNEVMKLTADGDLTLRGTSTILNQDSSKTPLTIVGASGQTDYLTSWQNSSSEIVAMMGEKGHLCLKSGLEAGPFDYGLSLVLWKNGGEDVKVSITNGAGYFDLTGGTYENLFTDTVNDPFDDVGVTSNKVLTIQSGPYEGAVAKIAYIVDTENAILHTSNWDFDLSGVDYTISNHPQMAVAGTSDIEMHVEDTGHVSISSALSYTGTTYIDSVFRVDSFMGEDRTRGVEFETRAQGYEDVRSLGVKILGGDLQPEDRVEGIAIELDDTGDSSADDTTTYYGLAISTTGASDASHCAIGVRAGFECALKLEGADEEDPEYGYEVSSGTVVDRVNGTPQDGTAFLGTSTSDLELFDDKYDYVLIGSDSTFESIQVSLSVVSSSDIKADFYYSAGSGVWTEFYPTDNTEGFTSSGSIYFTVPTGWATDDEAESDGDVSNAYYIKIVRNLQSWSLTPPTEDHFKIFESLETGMEIRGDGSIKPVKAIDLEMENDSIYYSPTLGNLVYKDSSGVVHDLY